MKILSNKKYNDLISKQFRGIFADVNDDNLLRENGLLYGENKELKQEIERLNNIINELEKDFKSYELEYLRETYQGSLADFIETELKRIQELKEDVKEII